LKHAVKYRPDIDGLRAIAILAVVLFHLNPKLVPGGYVGVDVFFVIPGYLITSIIYREICTGEFSLSRFYERRIRRLFPALLVVVTVSFVVAWIGLLPADFRKLSEALAATSLFIANLYFWKNTDYFSDPADSLPLLHTWSLAVEEQFYIFFPLVLILILRHKPGWLTGSLLALLLISLGWSEYALIDRPESVFYLPYYRAWELLAGAMLAIGAVPSPTSRRIRDMLAISGLALIAAGLFLYDKGTHFPGVAALPPVLGAALVIHAGTHARSRVGQWLSWKPLVFIGLISYSLYLWHWPLFIFVRYFMPHAQSSLLIDAGLLVAALALATLSWRFVERPFRHSSDHLGRIAVFTSASLAIAAMLVLALPGIVMRGAPFRFPPEIVDVAAVGQEEIPFRKPCFGLNPDQVSTDNAVCTIGAGSEPIFLLWGDSHALALAHGVDLAAKELDVSGYFLGRSLCPPVISRTNPSDYRKKCADFNLAALRFLDEHPTINTIILAGYWARYLNAPSNRNFPQDFVVLLDDLTSKAYRIQVIEQIPSVGWDVPSILARSRLFSHAPPPAMNRADHISSMDSFRQLLQTTRIPDRIQHHDLSGALCPGITCMAESHGIPLYRDANHLSKAGSAFLKEVLKPAIHPL
jgi:peptidoglycan/LPS O-acetylase OafA/YrhL